MITDSFLTSCLYVILNKKAHIRINKTLYRDVLEILEFYDDKEHINIPLLSKTKFECLKKICELKLEDRTNENVIDSVTSSEKYGQLTDLLSLITDMDISDEDILSNINQVRLRKKLTYLLSNYDSLDELLEMVKSGVFDSIDDLVVQFEDTIKQLFVNIMECNRITTIESSSSLDLAKDDYSHVLNSIVNKYSSKNSTSTGFPMLDYEILSGGFEPSRIYMIGGGSGAGKSTIINNFIVNSIMSDNQPKDNNCGVYVYITLENTIDESLLRTYQCMFDKSTGEAIADIKQGVDIRQDVIKQLQKNNASIIMKYFRPQSITPLDLTVVLDDVLSEYGEKSIRGLYLDYLDLLIADTKTDIYRLELSNITLGLKSIAVEYNIPVITATQLTRSAYRVQNASELNLDQMSEAIKKVEHADFVLLIAKDTVSTNIVHAKVGKNRSGPGNLPFDFNVDFSKYKFVSTKKVGATKTVDSMDYGLIDSFSGFSNEF